MPIKNYGVLKGHAIDRKLGKGNTPHFQIHILSGQTHYRIAVNVKSQSDPSTVLCCFDDHFDHPVLSKLKTLSHDFTPLKSQPETEALDYIRSNLFHRKQMKPIPYHISGPYNDLNEKLDRFVQRAMAEKDALVYAFGARWGPENGKPDRYFGFQPGNGIHDIHMNQGNSANWQQDDGVWQDGALLFHFPSKDQWVAVFTSFQSQSFYTDNQTGHALNEKPKEEGAVKIIAVLANGKKQSATLLNKSANTVLTSNWTFLNGKRDRQSIDQDLPSGASMRFELKDGFLSENGGLLTLVDDQGLKIDGVAYTEQDSKKQGWTISF